MTSYRSTCNNSKSEQTCNKQKINCLKDEIIMSDINEIHSLTDFQRNTKEYIGRLKQSGKPFVLTVNGKAEVIVQDAASYQKTLELIEWAETIAGIERGLDDVKHGRTKSIDQFAQQME